MSSKQSKIRAVVLAGGKGTRLAPYTRIFPKPLMPIGDLPILEIMLRQMKRAGIHQVTLTVGYLGNMMRLFFQDGARLGMQINYVEESKPLGTSGPLANVEGLEDTFLVTNGDVLTDLDLNELITYHQEQGAIATITTHKLKVNINLGVVELDKQNTIVDYLEKPSIDYLVSMGVYVFEPRVLEYIPKDESFTTKTKVLVYPVGTEIQLTLLLQDFLDGKYYWKVKAFYAGDARSPWSEVRIFKVDTVPPAVPKLYKPNDNKYKADFTPTLSVYPAAGAKYYHYQVEADDSFTSIVAESDGLAGLTWTVPVENELVYGEYFWRVMSIDAASNESSWSGARRLLISFQKLPKYGAVTTDRTPTFEWLAVANADSYKLLISVDQVVVQEYEIPSGLLFFTIPDDLTNGNNWWKMIVTIGTDEYHTPWSLLTIDQ